MDGHRQSITTVESAAFVAQLKEAEEAEEAQEAQEAQEAKAKDQLSNSTNGAVPQWLLYLFTACGLWTLASVLVLWWTQWTSDWTWAYFLSLTWGPMIVVSVSAQFVTGPKKDWTKTDENGIPNWFVPLSSATSFWCLLSVFFLYWNELAADWGWAFWLLVTCGPSVPVHAYLRYDVAKRAKMKAASGEVKSE